MSGRLDQWAEVRGTDAWSAVRNDTIAHGTVSGYKHCLARPEGSCADCRAAKNEANKLAYRASAATRDSVKVPTLLLAEVYLSAPIELQKRLEAEFGIAAVDKMVDRLDQAA